MAYQNFQPLLEVTRGPIVESVHYGAFAVVDSHGRLLASAGDPDTVTYLRSSAKPFQAMPLVELGGMQHFGLTEREIAVTCASHSGTDDHFAVISSIQRKVGVSENDLQCGMHEPMDDATARAMLLRGETPTSNRHNCSGKHSGMLAQAVLRALPLENYLDEDHLVQVLDQQTFAEMCDYPVNQIFTGIDGCSAPVWAVPLRAAAYGYARLADPHALSPARAEACRTITRSMMNHPDMVAGPGRFDTNLMTVGAGRIFSKGGAEGYQGIGVLPGVLGAGSPGLGITVKIADGDQGGRAVARVALAILVQLGVLTPLEAESLPKHGSNVVTNWRKMEVGEYRPIFKVEMPA